MRLPICDCFPMDEGGVVELRRLNTSETGAKWEDADGGNEFLDSLTGGGVIRQIHENDIF